MKPVVKITGEFWAQITEGDGNFHMFDFLEREGAQVIVEPIATWVAYLMYQAKAHAIAKWPVNRPHRNPEWYELKKNLANYFGLHKKLWGIGFGEGAWKYFYHRTIKNMGGITHHLVPQTELAEMAHPFYNQFARGGEGHLEVGKNVYYTVHKLCHMVLALKPFGCMPSSQSDGVQSAVVNKFKDMIFLPIETSGEGEVNAHSRVQMALGEAKVKAKTEFEQCLKSTGKSLDEIREYIAEHPELRRPFYHVPHREGVAGTAAQFILHVSDRMDKSTRLWKRSRVPGDRRAERRLRVSAAILLVESLPARWRSPQLRTAFLRTYRRDDARPSATAIEAAAIANSSCAPAKAARSSHRIHGGARRGLDHGQGDSRGCRDRQGALAGLPAPRDQAAGKDAGIPAAHGERSRHQRGTTRACS